MEEIAKLLVVAILVEAVSDWIKDVVQAKVRWTKIVALFVSIVVVFTLRLDLFILIGLEPAFPVIGGIFLSIFVSRGSNFVHDLLERLRSGKVPTISKPSPKS